MKRLLLLTAYLFALSTLSASTDQKWAALYSYASNTTMIQQIGTVVYGVSDGKLFSFDTDDESYETYGKLYNDNIVSICYVSSQGCLAIAYDDSYIQLLYPNGNVVNIAGIKNSQLNVDKSINELSASGTRLYVSTNFGVVVVDASQGVINESCILNTEVYSTCEKDSVIYAATQTGVLTVNRSLNIQDRSNWNTLSVKSLYNASYSDISFADTEISKIVLYNDLIHFLVKGKLICALKADGTVGKAIDLEPTNMAVLGGRLIAFKDNVIYNFTGLYTFNYAYCSLGTLLAVIPSGDDSFWVSCSGEGLSKLQFASNAYNCTVLKQGLYPNGPLSNYPYSMKYENNKLLVVGGGYFWYGFDNPPQFSTYNGSTWLNADKTQINEASGVSAKDFVSVVTDPSDTSHYFVAGWMDGIYEFKGLECTKLYDTSNSTLQSISGTRDIRTTSLCYDSDNNLWMTNSLVPSTIKMMTKAGVWKQYTFSSLASLQYVSQLYVDSYGTKWVGAALRKPALLVWNDNGTVDDTSDDTYNYMSSFVDQDANSLSIGGVNAIKQDLDGNIWLGTSIGPFKIYNSSTIASKSSIVLNTIKIPRNDGTDYVDILLQNVEINDIAIDGANQKWFATESAGVYLISADGLSTIYHFTKDNSILPSNRILSIALDKKTGVVYIGTEKGIVSFKSSYVEGSSDYSSVYSYPNPVRPDYVGDITIKGLQYNSAVRITDVNGNIINVGTSSGGTYIWNGKDVRGVRVKTGVYLVFAATESGDQGVATKILVVNY